MHLLGLGDGFAVSYLKLGFSHVCSLDHAWLLFLVWLTEQRPEYGLLATAWPVVPLGVSTESPGMESEFVAWCYSLPGLSSSSEARPSCSGPQAWLAPALPGHC